MGGGQHAWLGDIVEVFLVIVSIVDGVDVQLLPATFHALVTDGNLQFSPQLLGQIAVAQALCKALFAPAWGLCADRFARSHLLALNVVGWGFCTLWLGFAGSIVSMSVLRAMNGVFLAGLGPVSQSIVGDLREPGARGTLFGKLFCAQALGQVVGALYGTCGSDLGLGSWTGTYKVVGVASILLGMLVYMYMPEPARAKTFSEAEVASASEVIRLLGIPSFSVIVLQGVWGAIPGGAMAFFSMWYQSMGFSALLSSALVSTNLLGLALGGLVGGRLGDAMAQRVGLWGRPAVAQTGVLLGIASMLCLSFIPRRPEWFWAFALFMLLLGGSRWGSTGCTRPVLSEIVPPAMRGTALSMEVMVEGTSSALFGMPLCVYLLEHAFGYRKSTADAVVIDERNVQALALALISFVVIPWVATIIILSGLYRTYPADKALAEDSARLGEQPSKLAEKGYGAAA